MNNQEYIYDAKSRTYRVNPDSYHTGSTGSSNSGLMVYILVGGLLALIPILLETLLK